MGENITALKAIENKIDWLREDFKDFKTDAYNKINQNSKDIAQYKGINKSSMTTIAAITTAIVNMIYELVKTVISQ